MADTVDRFNETLLSLTCDSFRSGILGEEVASVSSGPLSSMSARSSSIFHESNVRWKVCAILVSMDLLFGDKDTVS
jgi:hypothetical protein